MVNYENGKIYSIRSRSRPDLVYIGSTCSELTKRLSNHVRKYKSYIGGKGGMVTSYDILEVGDYYIELVENCPCADKNELHRREGQIIRETTCVNQIIPGRTQKEYEQDNKESIAIRHKIYQQVNKERDAELHAQQARNYRKKNPEFLARLDKEYRQRNKEKIKARRGEKLPCVCGEMIGRMHMKKHQSTMKHIKNFILHT